MGSLCLSFVSTTTTTPLQHHNESRSRRDHSHTFGCHRWPWLLLLLWMVTMAFKTSQAFVFRAPISTARSTTTTSTCSSITRGGRRSIGEERRIQPVAVPFLSRKVAVLKMSQSSSSSSSSAAAAGDNKEDKDKSRSNSNSMKEDSSNSDSSLIGLYYDNDNSSSLDDVQRRNTLINIVAGGLLVATGVATWQLYALTLSTPPGFVRLPVTQFIAALGDPHASQGTNAAQWGLWRQDPGPRGVFLANYEAQLVHRNYVAPVGGWTMNPQDWWIEEHGLIMESPQFPLPPVIIWSRADEKS